LLQSFEEGALALVVQNPTGQFFNSVSYSDPREEPHMEGGTWHWIGTGDCRDH
jgi:hypothetical protein